MVRKIQYICKFQERPPCCWFFWSHCNVLNPVWCTMPVTYSTLLSWDCVRKLKHNVLRNPLHVLTQLLSCTSRMIEARYYVWWNYKCSHSRSILQNLSQETLIDKGWAIYYLLIEWINKKCLKVHQNVLILLSFSHHQDGKIICLLLTSMFPSFAAFLAVSYILVWVFSFQC